MRLALPKDPRWLQIAFHSSFLTTGMLYLHFSIPLWQPPAIILTAILTQWLFRKIRHEKLAPGELLSPLITGLGTSILLRTDAFWVGPLVVAIAVGSKFVIQVRGKHLFNPTNLALVLAMVATRHGWCSPSDWGQSAALVGYIACLGLAVSYRAYRSDVSLAFFAGWFVLKLARTLYLHAPWESLWLQLGTGGLIIFTFFMISDPKTTPDHRVGRLLYALGVASLGFFFVHQLWWQNGLLYALCLLSPVVPLIDRVLVADRFVWPGRAANAKEQACPPSAWAQPTSP